MVYANGSIGGGGGGDICGCPLSPLHLPRAVIDNACIDASTKKTLSIIDIEEGTTNRFICKLGK